MLDSFVALQSWVAHRLELMQERGATAVEYALMVGLIAIAIVSAVGLLGSKVTSTFNTMNNGLPG